MCFVTCEPWILQGVAEKKYPLKFFAETFTSNYQVKFDSLENDEVILLNMTTCWFFCIKNI